MLLRVPIVLIVLFLVFLFSFCKNETQTNLLNDYSDQLSMSGQELAKIHCGSCHVYPEPELLDQRTWRNSVLPQMAKYYGLESSAPNPYAGMKYEEIKIVGAAGVFPPQPTLPDTIWNKISRFYLDNAPASLTIKSQEYPSTDLFSQKPIALSPGRRPMTTLVKASSQNKGIYVADGLGTLHQLDASGKQQQTKSIRHYLTWIEEDEDGGAYLLNVGDIHPNDLAQGKLIYMDKDGNEKVLITGLQRPVYADQTDLNNDGLKDFVICNYGHHTGHLSWYESLGDDQYEAHLLFNVPGTIKSVVDDYNEDGLLDVMVLMGQGNEGFFTFFNNGDETFRQQNNLRFPPVFGSSDFQLADINGDGLKDILYVNGDNADYSIIPKPYHGLRIFIGQKEHRFRPAGFYPMQGATKVLVNDFNNDGNPDLFCSAFFPNFENNQSLIFFENTGASSTNLDFKIQLIRGNDQGRWLVLDQGDIDNDGDIDLITGSFTFAASPVPPELEQRWIKNGVGAVIWENKTK